jgi:hypothetical protein
MRSNEHLIGAIVADSTPCRADAGAERRLRDDAALPYDVGQLTLADDSIMIPNKVNEQIEDLRFDRNEFTPSPQFIPVHIDFKIAEAQIQGSPLLHHCQAETRDRSIFPL